MFDPKKLFVVSTVSREDISAALNNYLDMSGVGGERLADGDCRLTDELCQNYADRLHDIDTMCDNESDADEAEAQLQWSILTSMGFDMPMG